MFVRTKDSCPGGNTTLINQGAIPIDLSILSNTKHLREWFKQTSDQRSRVMINEQIALF